MRIRAVQSVVIGQESSDNCARHKSDYCQNRRCCFRKKIGVAALVIHHRADSRSCAEAHPSADEGIAQTVFIFQEDHAANVLPLNGLFA